MINTQQNFPDNYCRWKYNLQVPSKLNDFGHTRVYPTGNCFNCNGLNIRCDYYTPTNPINGKHKGLGEKLK